MASGAITNSIASASASAAANTSQSSAGATTNYEETRIVKPLGELSRRDFLAASGAAVAASGIGGQLASAASTSPSDSKLAIDGGPKAVQEKLTPVKRWGEPERAQL